MTDHLLAAITNPVLPAGVQNAATPTAAAGILGTYIGVLWRTALTLGGLAVVIYLLVGGFYWITAGGEKGKVEQAKDRIMQAIIGFAVLAAAAAISVFLSEVFGLDLLKPNFSVLMSSPGGGGSGGAGGPPGSCATVDPAVYGYISDGAYACYTQNPPDCVQCVGGAYVQKPESDPSCPAQCSN